MNLPRYAVKVSPDQLHYEFTSIGPKGPIPKLVEYTYLPIINCWNLGFGDFDEKSDYVDDSVVSDNGDGRKVLATVAMTLFNFFTEYPQETVIFTGSDELRTRVYQRAIAHYAASFSDILLIRGILETGEEQPWETGIQYFAFLIKLKQPT